MSEQPIQPRRRRSRFVRSTENLPPFRQGPLDADILKYVYEFRFLKTDHVVALTGADPTSIRKRLTKLWQHEYLDRRWDPPDNPQQGKAVHILDPKGAELLSQSFGIDPAEFNWRSDRDDVKSDKLQHALMIAHIRTVFTLATRPPADVKLLFWHNDGKEIHDSAPLADDDPVYKGARRDTLPVWPDSFFALRWPGPKAGKVTQGYFMLEADRATMSVQDYKNKLRGYWLWWKAGKHKEKFGIQHFVVLTVTLNAHRAQELFKASKDVDDRGTGSAMFWFSTVDKFALEAPEQILGDVWVTWNREEPARIGFVKRA